MKISPNKKRETFKGLRDLLKWNRSQVKAMRDYFTEHLNKYPRLLRIKNSREVNLTVELKMDTKFINTIEKSIY